MDSKTSASTLNLSQGHRESILVTALATFKYAIKTIVTDAEEILFAV
jgi:hypothetical protein